MTKKKLTGYMNACDLSEKCFMDDIYAISWGIIMFWVVFFLVLTFVMRVCLRQTQTNMDITPGNSTSMSQSTKGFWCCCFWNERKEYLTI